MNCNRKIIPFCARLGAVVFVGLNTLFGNTGKPQTVLAEGEYLILLPLVYNNFDPGPATVTGKVVDSTESDAPLEGAQVCFQDESLCTTTDADGNYSFEAVQPGFYSLTASLEGYFSVTSSTVAKAGPAILLNFALTPNFGDDSRNRLMRFVLIWNTSPIWPGTSIPNDLDANLWLESTFPYHIDSAPGREGACDGLYPNACLELDYQHGFGPETIAIQEYENATYYYGVLNYYYPGVPSISKSGARVLVYSLDGGLLNDFRVPVKGNGEFWYVFSMNSSGQIAEQNCIISLPAEGQYPQCP